ncbi:MAG TPA: orotidine-5'-phosphate decarboxylase [Actinomycetes bacterium]|nr:orotidine-5'-phosphate decarboxylase [Actinomycetes bacterium]
MSAPIAVALDAPDLPTAVKWATDVGPHVSTVKVGLQLFNAVGIDGVQQVREAAPDCRLFLDLKLHDIPNTVAGAARAVAELLPDLLTVHALGGPAMVRAACEALPDTFVTGVTILTSMSADDLTTVGLSDSPQDAVLRLARLAVDAGARALVCSPQEVAAVRHEVGPNVRLVTPGVRPAGADVGDQARVATPRQALLNGADLLVIGRPITAASDRGAAAAAIAESL